MITTTQQTQTETLVTHMVTRAILNPVPMISARGVHVMVPCSQVESCLASAYSYCADKGCRHYARVSRG